MRKLILTGVVFAFALALASAAVAKAKTLYFNGSPTHDHDATIQFTVKGTMTKGKFSPTEVLDIHVFNQQFSCYSAAGKRATSGRLEGSVDDYGYPGHQAGARQEERLLLGLADRQDRRPDSPTSR